MVPVRSRSFFSGIRDTQLGDPRAHGQECVLHCASADSDAGFGGGVLADAEAKDEEVAESGFGRLDVAEARLAVMLGAEVRPVVEDSLASGASFGHESGVCDLQRSAEISNEAISGRSVCGFQVSGSGYCCSK
jgi:hypothetical protein